MRNAFAIAFASATLTVACAGAPKPTSQLVETQAALRAAHEIGAKTDPQAQLYAKLAEDQVARAEKLMDDGDNEEAANMLARAKADAELGLALSRKAHIEQQ